MSEVFLSDLRHLLNLRMDRLGADLLANDPQVGRCPKLPVRPLDLPLGP